MLPAFDHEVCGTSEGRLLQVLIPTVSIVTVDSLASITGGTFKLVQPSVIKAFQASP